MKILIIEDEFLIARRIERMCREILGPILSEISCIGNLDDAKVYLETNKLDLVMLDLNLNGEDGLRILQQFAAESFHTIIVSAQKEKAVDAFDYGVVDFVSKPFEKERLKLALDRAGSTIDMGTKQLKFLSVKSKGTLKIIAIAHVAFFRGSDIYSEIHLESGEYFLHDKTLEQLSQLLSHSFLRIHKSYLVSIAQFECFLNKAGGRNFLRLKNGTELPIGRTRYPTIKDKLGLNR